MSHHSQEMPEELRNQFHSRRSLAEKLGATGDHPEGKFHESDEGEIRFAIGSDPDSGKVLLDFGDKPIAYVGMNPQQAVDLAQSLIKHARAVSKEPLRVVLN